MLDPTRRCHTAFLLTLTASLLGCAQSGDPRAKERSDARATGHGIDLARASGVVGPRPGEAADAPPISGAWTLTLTKTGAGTGQVSFAPDSLICDVQCQSDVEVFPDGVVVTLVATPAAGSTFLGWGGECDGLGDCVVALTADTAVSASFGLALPLGMDCSSSSECESGACVDGVCCDTACGDGEADCQSCNVEGSVGTCVALAADTTCRPAAGVCDLEEQCDGSSGVCPADALVLNKVVCREAAAGCDVAETCTGDSALCPDDAVAAAGDLCRTPRCVDDAWTPVVTCDGVQKSCEEPDSVPCGPYACTSAGCLVACAADTDCTTSYYCVEGQCVETQDDGASCTHAGQCSSGSCSDGVCCSSSCDGQCEACDLPGSEGTCVGVSGPPRGDRAACPGDGSLCAGSCNGVVRDHCTFADPTISCIGAHCEGGLATLDAHCDGAGTCGAPSTQDCGAYACGPTMCLGDCTADADCANGSFCSAGICVQLGAQGTACEVGHECLSGSCADGVCCDTACDGQCEACDIAESVGTCSPVFGSPRGGRPTCAGADPSCAGTCDGVTRSACIYPVEGTVCAPPSCVAGVASTSAVCDGAGACGAALTVDCAPFACGADICAGGCEGDEQCASDHHCSAGVCVALQPDGAACQQPSDCQGGNCVDGYCCNSSCTGQCEACDVPGREGVCAPSLGAPRGLRPACAGGGSTCSGACDGVLTTACAYPVVDCRPASCDGGVARRPATCDGQGACPPEELVDCGALGCGDVECRAACEDDLQCDASSFCSAGVCHERLPLGGPCGASSECGSGACVDGVCCDSACEGQCAACNLPGSVGVCSAVLGPPQGGRPSCGDVGPCGGSCDGATMTACAFPGADTECGGPSSCADGVATLPGVCDGAGQCQGPVSRNCGAPGCEGDVCATGCEDDSACASGRCISGRCESASTSSGAGGDSGDAAASPSSSCSVSTPGLPWQTSAAVALATLAALLLRRRRA